MYRFKLPTVATHVTGWLIFLSLPVLFIAGQSGKERAWETVGAAWYWLLFGSYIVVFYLHTYWLFPALYLKKRTLLYAALVFLLLIGIDLLRPFDRLFLQLSRPERERMIEDRPPPPPREAPFPQPPPEQRPGLTHGPRQQPFDFVSIFLFLLTMSLSIALQSTWRWRTTEKRALQAEAEKAQAELAFLKAQINPHFLFNTLNNIYSLAITRSEHTATSIMKLSNILRYVTDEVKQDLVPLQQEIDCIRDYIDLQQLRIGQKTAIRFTVGGDLSSLSIAPLLLMNFLENAFKHGVSNHQASSITVEVQAAPHQVVFRCANALFPRKQADRTGIGIANTRQRLEHLYPHQHQLHIATDNNQYRVELILEI